VTRTMKLDGAVLTMDERIDSTGAEIPVPRLPQERDAVTTAKSSAPRLVAPAATARRWDLDGKDPAGSSQIAAIDTIFAKAIADDPEEVAGYTSRASFRAGVANRTGAVADLTKAIAIAPSVDLYLKRSAIRYGIGDIPAALSDAEAARALDPSSEQAISAIASYKAEQGDLASGIALMDQRIALGGNLRSTFRTAKASLVGEYGDPAEAIKQFDALIAEKPGSPDLMNARCWTKGTRNLMIETALKDCTASIELSTDTTAALDSRAMVWFRLGRYDEALADLDAVMAAAPNQSASRFMRGIVLQRLDRTGEAATELKIARKTEPGIDRHYARYGIVAK
jgi:tetratricopeptide (TPR) repeat protein